MKKAYCKARAASHTCATWNIGNGADLDTLDIKIFEYGAKYGVLQFIHIVHRFRLRVLTANFISFEKFVRADVHVLIDCCAQYGAFFLAKETL